MPLAASSTSAHIYTNKIINKPVDWIEPALSFSQPSIDIYIAPVELEPLACWLVIIDDACGYAALHDISAMDLECHLAIKKY